MDESKKETYRRYIAEYDRPSGPQTLVTPDGWRDALRDALDDNETLSAQVAALLQSVDDLEYELRNRT